MKLATIRHQGSTRAVRLEDDRAIDLGFSDVVDVVRQPNWRQRFQDSTGAEYGLGSLEYAPLVGHPDKIICVGLNYRHHIEEMGRDIPEYPTLFAKYRGSLIGAHDDLELPRASRAVDWEAELAIIIGSTARNIDRDHAGSVIAGYTVLNDVTCRDWQYRTTEWLQGKTFERTTPIGPWLVTDGADQDRPAYDLSCMVNEDLVQSASTDDLVFDPWTLVAYISEIITLLPGDVISTGTPGGVGHASSPPRYLTDGDVLQTSIEGIGSCRNACRGAE